VILVEISFFLRKAGFNFDTDVSQKFHNRPVLSSKPFKLENFFLVIIFLSFFGDNFGFFGIFSSALSCLICDEL
jgi:hypothetical protein